MEERIVCERNPNEIDLKLRKVLLEALQVRTIGYEDTIETVDVWDSMMHIEIIVALESNYSIKIEPEEIVSLISVRAIQEFLKSKGKL